MSSTKKFDLSEWLVPPVFVPHFLGAGCRRAHYSLVGASVCHAVACSAFAGRCR